MSEVGKIGAYAIGMVARIRQKTQFLNLQAQELQEDWAMPSSAAYIMIEGAIAEAMERGRIAEREECAKVADAHAEGSISGDFWKGINTASREIARTIRARSENGALRGSLEPVTVAESPFDSADT